MRHVLENPFRMLGLPVSATDRQIAKRVMEAETYLELGKPLAIAEDFPWMPPINRTAAAMKEAQGKLHRLEDRSFHSLFWFHSHDSVDQLALEILQSGNIDKALAIWDKAESVSNLINLYVLRFALAGAERPDPREHYLKGLSTVGRTFSAVERFQSFVHAANISRVDPSRILQDIQQEALHYFVDGKSLLSLPGPEIRVLISAFITFPKESRAWIEDRLFEESKEVLDTSIKGCSFIRKGNPDEAVNAAQTLIRDARPVLVKVASALPKQDPRIAILHDLVAEEILQCSIDYHNFVMGQDEDEELPLQPALEIIAKAESMAFGPVLKHRIHQGLPVLQEHADAQASRELISQPMDEFFHLLEGLPKPGQAEPPRIWGLAKEVDAFITKVQLPLQKIKDIVGAEDRNYIELSSVAVHVSISLLIDFANHTRDMDTATRVLNRLFTFDVDKKTKARLVENSRIAISNLAQAPNRSSCYIATCVYGGPDVQEVIALRRFRDARLKGSLVGRAFIALYYRISPYLVRHLAKMPCLHSAVRCMLGPVAHRWMKAPNPH